MRVIDWPRWWSWLVVVVRSVLLVRFVGVGGVFVVLAGVSEGWALVTTVLGLRHGLVDASFRGAFVPLCYLLPLFLDGSCPHGCFALAPAFVCATVVDWWFRLCLGFSCSVGVPVFLGVRDRGPYALVRHPLAAVEAVQVSLLAGVLGGVGNGLVAVVVVLGCVGSCLCEERFLLRRWEYRSYALRVRWRWFPGVW